MMPKIWEGAPLDEREATLLVFLEGDEVEEADLMHLVCHARHRHRLLGAVVHHVLFSAGMANTIAYEVPPFSLEELQHIIGQFFSNPMLPLHLESDDAEDFQGLIEELLSRFAHVWVQKRMNDGVLNNIFFGERVKEDVVKKLCRIQNQFPDIGFPLSYIRLYDNSDVSKSDLADWILHSTRSISWKDQMRFLREVMIVFGVDESIPSIGEPLWQTWTFPWCHPFNWTRTSRKRSWKSCATAKTKTFALLWLFIL